MNKIQMTWLYVFVMPEHASFYLFLMRERSTEVSKFKTYRAVCMFHRLHKKHDSARRPCLFFPEKL